MVPQTRRDEEIQQRLVPVLNPEHDLNVNRKYSYLYRLIPNEFVGQSIFKTNKYVSLVTAEELQAKRTEFWGFVIRK